MELLLKVILGMLIAAGIILGIMAIVLAAGGLWSYIQDCLHDEWLHTGELTSDIVPQKVMKCSYCDYKTTIMSRCCPACGTYMNNWDLE